MPTGNLTFLSAATLASTWYDYGTSDITMYAGRSTYLYNSNGYSGYCTTFIKFRTPSYLGNGTNLSINVPMWTGTTSSIYLTASISSIPLGNPSSDTNTRNYIADWGSVSGAPGRMYSQNVLVTGLHTYNGTSDAGTSFNVINTDTIQLAGNTEYTLVLSFSGSPNGTPNTDVIQIKRMQLPAYFSGTITYQDTVSVSFAGNAQSSGSVSNVPGNQTFIKGSSITIPSTIPTHSNIVGTTQNTVIGYANGGTPDSTKYSTTTTTISRSFLYWQDGSGNIYYANNSYAFNNSVTLYAQWSASTTASTPPVTLDIPTRASITNIRYTATFDANGGSVSPSTLITHNYVSYTFQSWNTASNGTGVVYGGNNGFTSSATVYAQWSENVTNETYVVLPTPTRSGYNFRGWSTNPSATVGDRGNYTLTSNVTLYAIWVFKGLDYTMYLGREKIDKIYLGDQEVNICIPIE